MCPTFKEIDSGFIKQNTDNSCFKNFLTNIFFAKLNLKLWTNIEVPRLSITRGTIHSLFSDLDVVAEFCPLWLCYGELVSLPLGP